MSDEQPKAAAAPPSKASNMLFAIPKKGRLHDQIIKLLKGAGLSWTRPPRVDIAHCNTLPITLVFLPAADIAAYVGEGNVDMGITGQDIIAETRAEVNHLQSLGFGKCVLAVQAPVVSNVADVKSLAGKRIVTSFPNLAREYFSKFEDPSNPTSVKYVSGSVEAACGLGLADAVVDLVETGTTMRAAGLEVVSNVMNTEAVLISNPKNMHGDLVGKLKKRIEGHLAASRFNMINYNIERRNLVSAYQITPGKRSPTVSPLEDPEWVAVAAMIDKKKTSDIMDELERLGATDILVFAIDNCRV